MVADWSTRDADVMHQNESSFVASEHARPGELFRGLFVGLEDQPRYVALLRHSMLELLAGCKLPELCACEPQAWIAALLAWARRDLACDVPAHYAPSWPARLVREYAPAGLSDGAWLRGAISSPLAQTELGICLLAQFRWRWGEAASQDGHAQRYAVLLKSLGTPPAAIQRWEWEESSPCTDVSYEHALLGLGLGLFPNTLLPEMLGFNLWMSEVGPAPLLERLCGELQARGANLRYFAMYDRRRLGAMASAAVMIALRVAPAGERWQERIHRGFAAAHRSYLHWESAMLGPNIPVTAWDSVLDMVRRKARFAATHHRAVRLGEYSLEELFRNGKAGHERLVEELAKSRLVRPGAPERSRFLTHSLSLRGTMFDAFTPSEKQDLQAWIAQLGTADAVRTTRSQVALRASYWLGRAASVRCPASEERWLESLANADHRAELAVSVRAPCRALIAALTHALRSDERLAHSAPPAYSDAALVHVLDTSPGRAQCAHPGLPLWLMGSCDPRRSVLPDQRWLFSSYHALLTSAPLAHDDGLVARLARALPLHNATQRIELALRAFALNTSYFTPEVLGIQLAVATLWSPLADGLLEHDALRAVRAYLARVRAAAPASVERQWQRIWASWRVIHICVDGAPAERAALVEALSTLDLFHTWEL